MPNSKKNSSNNISSNNIDISDTNNSNKANPKEINTKTVNTKTTANSKTTTRNYHDQININNDLKLREMLKELPRFCMTFFRGIEYTTSSRTRIAYAYDLGVFFNYIKDTNPAYADIEINHFSIDILNKITVDDIEEYLDYLKVYSKNSSEHTNREKGIKRKLSSLKSFYNYFFCNQIIEDNPAAKVRMPKLHESEIIRLDSDEVERLLDEVESGDNLTKSQKKYHDKTKLRDTALLTLLLGTGMRVSECVGIDINDVDFKNSGIKVRRKGGYEAIVYFGDEVEIALLNYLEYRNTIKPVAGHENALFLSLQNKRISVRSVENLVKKYSGLITTLKHITPHKLRSTYGTNLYKETGDIYLVADVLGHKDVNTTRKHYAAIEDRRRYNARNEVSLRRNKEEE
ncbi:site-specific recombinase phage integrase family [Eubacterium sp. CAG:603]|jgi:Site-specific recombinase XerD|nr:site-specific recombinase phage integrase family [Eubacterium sp. CAG:603]